MFGYLIYSLGAPHRFPHFFNNPGMLAFWVLGFGLVTAAAVLLRARMKRAHAEAHQHRDRKSTRLNSSHGYISYAVFCLKKKKKTKKTTSSKMIALLTR